MHLTFSEFQDALDRLEGGFTLERHPDFTVLRHGILDLYFIDNHKVDNFSMTFKGYTYFRREREHSDEVLALVRKYADTPIKERKYSL